MHYQSSGAFLSLLRGKKKERKGKKKTTFFQSSFLMKIKGSKEETTVILKKNKISLHAKDFILVWPETSLVNSV